MTTRPVQVAGDQFMTAFTREALESLASQVREGHVAMTPEHLSYLGPIGRWVDAEVIDLDDGESELVMYGAEVKYLTPVERDPVVLESLRALPETSSMPPSEIGGAVELRIFDEEDAQAIRDSAPLPLRHENRWAELPPLEWIISVPVVWGAARFAGAFFDELGRVSAKSLASWLSKWSRRAKENHRDWMVTLRFSLPDGETVYGFIPVSSGDSRREERIAEGLNDAGVVAALAGAQAGADLIPGANEIALILDEANTWQLAWWTEGGNVFHTRWFKGNCPDPERFLGRPLFETPDDGSRADANDIAAED